MYTSETTSITDKKASEATPQESKATEHVGYVGFHHVFSHTLKKGSYEGQNREKPYIPYINTSTQNVPQVPTAADGEAQKEMEKPYRDPTCTSNPTEEWEEFIL